MLLRKPTAEAVGYRQSPYGAHNRGISSASKLAVISAALFVASIAAHVYGYWRTLGDWRMIPDTPQPTIFNELPSRVTEILLIMAVAFAVLATIAISRRSKT